jgi:hypothetical protein
MRMCELNDTLVSVQVLFWAPNKQAPFFLALFMVPAYLFKRPDNIIELEEREQENH